MGLEINSRSLETATAKGATATADDVCHSYVASVICPPVAPPSVSTTAPITGKEVEMQEDKGKTDVDASMFEDVCPKGHELRWHAWCCASCDKRGYGLRFGCVECREANL